MVRFPITYLVLLPCLLLGVASHAQRGRPSLRIDYLDTDHPPQIKIYLTDLDSGSVPITDRKLKNYRLLVDAIPQTGALKLKRFFQIHEPMALTMVIQASPALTDAFAEITDASKKLIKSLPPKSKVGLIAYTDVVLKGSIVKPGPADEASAAVDFLRIYKEALEVHLPDALKDAMEGLDDPKLPRRKAIVVVSDGLTADLNFAVFSELGRKAKDKGIAVYAVGYAPLEPAKLRTLVELSKRGDGTYREAKNAEEVTNAFSILQEELRNQIVISYKIGKFFDGKLHDFQIETPGGQGTSIESAELKKMVQKKKAEEAWYQTTWFLVVLIAVGQAGLIIVALFILRARARAAKVDNVYASYDGDDDNDDEDDEEDEFGEDGEEDDEEDDEYRPSRGKRPLEALLSPPSMATDMGKNLGTNVGSGGGMPASPFAQPSSPAANVPAVPYGQPAPAPLVSNMPPVPHSPPGQAMSPNPLVPGGGPPDAYSQPGQQAAPSAPFGAPSAPFGTPAMPPGTPAMPPGAPAMSPGAPGVPPEAGSLPGGANPQPGQQAVLPTGPFAPFNPAAGPGTPQAPQAMPAPNPLLPSPAGSQNGSFLPLPDPEDFMKQEAAAQSAVPLGDEPTVESMGNGSFPGVSQVSQHRELDGELLDTHRLPSVVEESSLDLKRVSSSPAVAGSGIPLSSADLRGAPSVPGAGAQPGRLLDRQTQVMEMADWQGVDYYVWIIPLGGTAAQAVMVAEQMVFGSDPSCDYQVVEEGVQPRHAILKLDDKGYYVETVTEQGPRAQSLEDEDHFFIGSREFVFKLAAGQMERQIEPIRLEVMDGMDRGRSIPLHEAMLYTIGSDNSCDLVVRGEQIEKRHAIVLRKDRKCIISDLGTPAGIRYKGEQVGYRKLKAGEEISLNEIRLVYTYEDWE